MLKTQEAGFEWVYIDTDGLQMVRKHVDITAHINNVKSLMILLLLVP